MSYRKDTESGMGEYSLRKQKRKGIGIAAAVVLVLCLLAGTGVIISNHQNQKKPEEKKPEQKAEEKKTEPKAAEKKVTAKKAPAKKTTAKKTTTKKTTAKKSTAKKEIKVSAFVEYYGKQVEEKEIIARVKKAWTSSGNKIGDIKTMDLYIKPEESAVYYVINGTSTGAVAF